MKKLLLLIALVTFATPAFALDLTEPLRTYDNKDFVDKDGKVLGLTADLVIQNALLTAPTVDEADKKQNYILSLKVHDQAKNYTPITDDIVRIRKALALTQNTAIFGRVTSLIDPTFLKN